MLVYHFKQEEKIKSHTENSNYSIPVYVLKLYSLKSGFASENE